MEGKRKKEKKFHTNDNLFQSTIILQSLPCFPFFVFLVLFFTDSELENGKLTMHVIIIKMAFTKHNKSAP